MQVYSIDLAELSLLPEVWSGNLMAVVLAGVEECRERGRDCLLGIERLTHGRDLSASFRSNFGMENGTGDIWPELLRLVLRSGVSSWEFLSRCSWGEQETDTEVLPPAKRLSCE